MEKRGLVERRHATGDRRVVLVYLTDAGGHVFRDMADRRRDALSTVLSELTEPEMAALLIGMRAILSARRRMIEANPGPPIPEMPPAG